MLAKKKWRKIDIIAFILFPIIAVILAWTLKVNYLVSILLFFGIPSLYLSIRRKDIILRTGLFALILTVLGYVIDYINHISNSWVLPTIFPFRLFSVPVEDIFWMFFMIYFVVMFYEHFLNKRRKLELINKKMKYFVYAFIALLVLFFITFFTNPELLVIKYAYFWTTFVFLFIPTIVFLYFYPKFLPKYVKLVAYFLIVFILMEITGLQFGHWFFTGSYIGWIELFGYKFAFEEFFFLMLFGPTAALTYYEFFDDDRK